MAKRPKVLPNGNAALSSAFVDLFDGGPDRKPKTEVRLFSKGVNGSDKGDFLFDDKAAAMVMASYLEKGVDCSIDYDHQALATPQVKAPAAGWFNLAVREGELWAVNLRWTPQATAHLEAAEYRYFSPLFGFDEATGRITSLINLALTNTPALHGIEALVAASSRMEDTAMEEELKKALARNRELEGQLAALHAEQTPLKVTAQTMVALSGVVGLAAGAAISDVQTAVTSLVSVRNKLLELTGKDSTPAALGTIEAWKTEAADSVRMKAQLETERLAALSVELKGLLDDASTASKIPPGERPGYEQGALAFGAGKPSKEGNAWLRARVEALSARVATDPARPPAGVVGLTETEKEIARQTGSDIAALKKYKEKKLGGGAAS